MTSPGFLKISSAIALAMDAVFKRAQAGQHQGTVPCPKCQGTIHYQAPVPHQSSGRCRSCGIHWP